MTPHSAAAGKSSAIMDELRRPPAGLARLNPGEAHRRRDRCRGHRGPDRPRVAARDGGRRHRRRHRHRHHGRRAVAAARRRRHDAGTLDAARGRGRTGGAARAAARADRRRGGQRARELPWSVAGHVYCWGIGRLQDTRVSGDSPSRAGRGTRRRRPGRARRRARVRAAARSDGAVLGLERQRHARRRHRRAARRDRPGRASTASPISRSARATRARAAPTAACGAGGATPTASSDDRRATRRCTWCGSRAHPRGRGRGRRVSRVRAARVRGVTCWGMNHLGQSHGTPDEVERPRPVPGVTGAIELSAGEFRPARGCAIGRSAAGASTPRVICRWRRSSARSPRSPPRARTPARAGSTARSAAGARSAGSPTAPARCAACSRSRSACATRAR